MCGRYSFAIVDELINAKAETIDERPAYRNAFKKRRCLVPADGFYEWKKNGNKIPYWIILKNGDPFAMAGIWEKWVSSDGEIIHSFSIITTEPNELMAPIHDRMPVILLPETEKMWLDDTNEEVLKGLLKPYPADLMRAFPISTLVNSPKNDSQSIIKPI
ncbi:MAG: SOS response-associated peptidase [Bacteroidales bacterium]|nr:SOS response-associated peptidase [Bacteroidales bacterium]